MIKKTQNKSQILFMIFYVHIYLVAFMCLCRSSFKIIALGGEFSFKYFNQDLNLFLLFFFN